MNRTRTFENHEMSIYKQVSGSIYGLLDHEKHENHNLPVNPNFLLFKDKSLNKKLNESLFRELGQRGPSLEFKSNLQYFYIFHFSFLSISFFINILLNAYNSQTYNHFLLRITFLSVIFAISLLILVSLLRYNSLLSHTRLIFASLSVLIIIYLVVCDERILSGISGQQYESSNSSTIIIISIYTVMIRYVLLDSFIYMVFLCTFALIFSLILLMSLSTVSIFSGLLDFLTLFIFLIIQMMETHNIDFRTRQLFWRKQMEEEYLENIEILADENEAGVMNINTEIELIIKACDRIKQTIKTASAVIMYKDVKNKLKSAQSELEKVKRRMAQGGFMNVSKLEQHPGISEDDKMFIVENFTDLSSIIPKRSRPKDSRLSVVTMWTRGVSDVENLLSGAGNNWNLDFWFVYNTTGHSLYILGKHLIERWQLTETLLIPRNLSDSFFLNLERVNFK